MHLFIFSFFATKLNSVQELQVHYWKTVWPLTRQLSQHKIFARTTAVAAAAALFTDAYTPIHMYAYVYKSCICIKVYICMHFILQFRHLWYSSSFRPFNSVQLMPFCCAFHYGSVWCLPLLLFLYTLFFIWHVCLYVLHYKEICLYSTVAVVVWVAHPVVMHNVAYIPCWKVRAV